MKGYELIKEIENGNIDNCKIKWKYPGGEGIIEVVHRTLKWEPGGFSTKILTSSFAMFEVIEENKEIKEIPNEIMNDDWRYYVPIFYNKINELVRAVNKLNKEKEDMIITTSIFDYFASLVLRRFEEENEFDESVVNNFKAICDVLKIKYKTSIIESDKKESK